MSAPRRKLVQLDLLLAPANQPNLRSLEGLCRRGNGIWLNHDLGRDWRCTRCGQNFASPLRAPAV